MDNENHLAPQTDVLAQVLQFMGLEGNLFCKAELKAPWALYIPSDGLVHFHHIQKGVCRLRRANDYSEKMLSAGDLVLLTHGRDYTLYDAPGNTALNIQEVIDSAEKGNACSIVRFGGTGPQTQMLCGSFRFKPGRERMILPLLPPVFVLQCEKYLSGASLEAILEMIAAEAVNQGSGSSYVLSRLVEILFIHILRSWMESPQGQREANWINALRDERIAQALGALHSKPEFGWTVENLAGRVNLSRSPFALRFKRVVGHGPMSYLRQLRLDIASDLLAENRFTLKEIAARVGYDSEASFSKAFKSNYGIAPGRWRSQNRQMA